MKDYSKGIIYYLKSPNCGKIYYGSTIEDINVRFSKHKTNSNGCTSKQIINSGDAEIFEIEKYPCSNIYELEDREAEYIINNYKQCVNLYIPGAIRRAGGTKEYDKARDKEPKRKQKKKERRAEKVTCNLCGCIVSRGNIGPHQKTQKCLNACV